MDVVMKNTHLRQISTHKPQLLVLSSIQEHPSSKISDKNNIKASIVADADSEIGVFGAEKYFSMKLDHTESTVEITKPHEKENREVHPHPHPHPQLMKTTSSRSRTSRHSTPSIRSESSYNSQTFLMRVNNNDNKQRKTNESSISFGGFRCNSPCSGVKTVNTDRKISVKGRISDRDFVAYDARKHNDNKSRLHFEAKKMDYHEPLPIQRSDIAVNLEKKLSMLTWDAIPNNHSTKKNNHHHHYNNCNNSSMSSKTQEEETASETSSDLFEIENITSSTAYEPSEASIGWSVVTGVADQSVISNFDMRKRVARNGSVVKTKPAVAEKVRSGGFLSGCKTHKAVLVVDSTRNVKEAAKVDQKKFKSEIRIQDLSFL